MREVLSDIDRWRVEGSRIALARVVGVVGSSPREPGATMAVTEDGRVAGSVSGGCVEGAVVEEALSMLWGDASPRTVTFGYSDEEAFSVGLTCGGTINLLLAPLPATYDALRGSLLADEPVALATVLAGSGPVGLGGELVVPREGGVSGTLGEHDLDRVVVRDALAALDTGMSDVRHYGLHGEARMADVTVLVEAFVAAPRLIIFGAVDFSAALARVAKVLGFKVVVCDARPVFATPARFPMVDEVVVDWPDRYLAKVGDDLGPRDAVCVLTHDSKFDVPALEAALGTRVGYLGAMGSRRTHADRTRRLVDRGAGERDLARVMGPIGIDIGARSPEETAVSICAEIIALRTGRDVPSLSRAGGPIHGSGAAVT